MSHVVVKTTITSGNQSFLHSDLSFKIQQKNIHPPYLAPNVDIDSHPDEAWSWSSDVTNTRYLEWLSVWAHLTLTCESVYDRKRDERQANDLAWSVHKD